MSKTFTESRNLKQKAAKGRKPMLQTIKKNLHTKMNYADYIDQLYSCLHNVIGF